MTSSAKFSDYLLHPPHHLSTFLGTPLPSQSSLDVIYGSFPDGLGAKRAWRRSRFGEGAIDELLYIQVTLHNVMYRNVDEMTSLLESGVRGEAATRLKFDHRDFDWDDTTVVVQAKAKFCNRMHGCYEPPAYPISYLKEQSRPGRQDLSTWPRHLFF